MKKRTGLNIIAALIVLTAVSLAIYRYGYRIPVLKEIPFFSQGHEHEWRPVLTAEGEIDYWTCAMHPSVKMKEPGNCPICGMELIPVMKKPDTEAGPPSEDAKNEGVSQPTMRRRPIRVLSTIAGTARGFRRHRLRTGKRSPGSR